jgi:hypothetical protein
LDADIGKSFVGCIAEDLEAFDLTVAIDKKMSRQRANAEIASL